MGTALTCQELVELVTDYLEGALPPALHAQVRDHLADCDDCLRYVGQIRLTARLLARLPAPEPGDTLAAALAGAFRAAAEGDQPDGP